MALTSIVVAGSWQALLMTILAVCNRTGVWELKCIVAAVVSWLAQVVEVEGGEDGPPLDD